MRFGRCSGCGHSYEIGEHCQFCYTTSKVVGKVTAYDSWMRNAQQIYAREIVAKLSTMVSGDSIGTYGSPSGTGSSHGWTWTKS